MLSMTWSMTSTSSWSCSVLASIRNIPEHNSTVWWFCSVEFPNWFTHSLPPVEMNTIEMEMKDRSWADLLVSGYSSRSQTDPRIWIKTQEDASLIIFSLLGRQDFLQSFPLVPSPPAISKSFFKKISMAPSSKDVSSESLQCFFKTF